MFLRVGYDTDDQGTLKLPTNNTINVGTLSARDSATNNGSLGGGILLLGLRDQHPSGQHNCDRPVQGNRRIGFKSAAGTVSISGTNGSGTAALTIGNASSATWNPGNYVPNPGLILAGHTAQLTPAR